MNNDDKHLLEEEEVLYSARLHRVVFGFPAFWTLLTLILICQDSVLLLLGLVTGVVAIVTWIRAAIAYSARQYVLTTKRVLVSSGLLSRQTVEFFLKKIDSVQVRQGFLGRLLGYGTIDFIRSNGVKDPFTLVSQPLHFSSLVQEQVERVIE